MSKGVELDNIDHLRSQLEANIAKVKKAIRHWQTWDAEYEGLKEELEEASESATSQELEDIAKSAAGTLVDAKEIAEILGQGKNPRSQRQVLDLLKHRIEYVRRNITALQKQLDKYEEQLITFDDIQGDSETDSGLPLTEIVEELDEHDNVIASRLVHPENATPQLFEALKNAGLTRKDLDQPKAEEAHENIPTLAPSEPSATDLKTVDPSEAISGLEITEKPEAKHEKDDQTKLAELVKGSFTPDERVILLDEDEAPIAATKHEVLTDTPEDAALRRQMLQYSLEEVGNVVAQLDLDAHTDASDWDGASDYSADSDSYDEDEHGLSSRSNMTDEYRQEMLELEKRLNSQSDKTEDHADVKRAEDVRRLVVRPVAEEASQPEETADLSKQTSRRSGKSVRFAESLDVAPVSKGAARGASIAQPDSIEQDAVTPVNDTVVERKASTTVRPPVPTPRMSKYRKARLPSSTDDVQAGNTPLDTDTAPLLNDVVVERPHTGIIPGEPDELDPHILRSQIASEYYRQRSRMINRQGHSSTQADADFEEYEDDTEAPPAKISLFKKARLGNA